ncbi:hypothetical protein L475_05021 [Escherichia coli BIDMC 38]|nr:hypothetical protein [Escherichia coli]ESL29675.1 hypothetical protein L475_05021 [Escherichia coli BIDMC 38]
MSTRNIHVNTASYTLLVAGKKKNTGEEVTGSFKPSGLFPPALQK